MANDVVDPTGEAAAGTMSGEGPGTGSDSDFSQYVANSPPSPQQPDTTKYSSVIGSEFGEVDNPAYSFNSKASWDPTPWNVGAWGDNIAGWDTMGVALPNGTRGTLVHLRNPETGQTITAPVIDQGPGVSTGAQVDMTAGVRRALGYPRNYRGPVEMYVEGLPSESDDFSQYVAQEKPDDDFSKYVTTGKDVPHGTSEESDFSKYVVIESNHPVAQQTGWSLPSLVQNIWNYGKYVSAQQKVGLLQSQVKQAGDIPDEGVERQIADINASPYYTAEQKQENIAALRQGQAKELADRKDQLGGAQVELKHAQEQVAADNPQEWQKVLGSLGPYFKTLPTGPLSPLLSAQLATSETFGQKLDESAKKYKELHPDASDAEITQHAVAAASESARGSGGAMLALGYIDIPAVGPTIAKIAQKLGWGAATMEIANTLAQVQSNMATKKNIDPKQDITEGIKDVWFHVQNLTIGALLAAPHALGEVGKPSHEPISDRLPVTEVPDTKEVEVQLPESTKLPSEQTQRTAAEEPRSEEPKEVLTEPIHETDSYLSQFANRLMDKRIASGEIGEIAPGHGFSTEELVKRGEKMGPEQIAQHVSDVMQGRVRSDSVDQAIAIRTREAQLSAEANRLSRINEDNPTPENERAYREAKDAADVFRNGPVRIVKQNWAQTGKAMQGEIPIDVGSVNGLRDAWLQDVGKEPSPRVEEKMKELAKSVREATAEEERIARSEEVPRLGKLTDEEVMKNIIDRMGGDDPCVV
jgi:hypothetical protein